jgi:hypothetical protein
MSPNLSFEHLAVVLALAGCSKATPAAETSTTVRSDPTASAQVVNQAAPPPPGIAASAAPVTGGAGPGGAASATDLRKKEKNVASPAGTGQASCGAGSCTSEIKKK